MNLSMNYGKLKKSRTKRKNNSKGMENVNFKTWFKNQPMWLKIVVATAIAIAAVFGAGSAMSCTATHKVVQSYFNTQTGDTIGIKFEQSGRVKK